MGNVSGFVITNRSDHLSDKEDLEKKIGHRTNSFFFEFDLDS